MTNISVDNTFDATMTACRHVPCCPAAEAFDRDAAHVVSARPEQGWSLLCNGVVVFEDFGELLPNGQSVDARRGELIAASPHRHSAQSARLPVAGRRERSRPPSNRAAR